MATPTYPDVDDLDNCPKCGVSWIGEEISKENQEFYGEATHFRRLIAVEYGYMHPERYDGVSEYRCPDCSFRVGRWTGLEIPKGYIESRFGAHGVVPTKKTE